ncbi:zinc-binding dehydrogenase [Saccharopolyspora gloriosae]|uniref:quinone oxidoreductase family protein n=1 Tax=Saccharopolyspora gloriosae TaxID=455344 RepID=UPI001FB5BF8D|nr:zinc-binding dehydrogenase [Saccharopolyspora gloriosae]
MSETMTALFGGAGPDWESRRVPVPEPGPGQVLVRARAVAVNEADISMLDRADPASGGSGEPYLAGFEFAGEVAALGDGVDDAEVGERVMGTTPRSFAQYVLADHRHLARVPGEIGFEEAAALPTGLLTEHGSLQLGGFAPGQTVLITAGTSGIGLIGVQMAKALGARSVLATTRSADKHQLLRRAGADVVVNTTTQNLAEVVLDATGGQGVDLVLDHVAGQTFADCLPATRVDGHVVNIGRLDRAASTIDIDALSYRHLRLIGVSFGFTRAEELGQVIAGLAPEVLPAVASGEIRATIDSTFELTQAAQAAARIRGGQAQGKIVLSLS